MSTDMMGAIVLLALSVLVPLPNIIDKIRKNKIRRNR